MTRSPLSRVFTYGNTQWKYGVRVAGLPFTIARDQTSTATPLPDRSSPTWAEAQPSGSVTAASSRTSPTSRTPPDSSWDRTGSGSQTAISIVTRLRVSGALKVTQMVPSAFFSVISSPSSYSGVKLTRMNDLEV